MRPKADRPSLARMRRARGPAAQPPSLKERLWRRHRKTEPNGFNCLFAFTELKTEGREREGGERLPSLSPSIKVPRRPPLLSQGLQKASRVEIEMVTRHGECVRRFGDLAPNATPTLILLPRRFAFIREAARSRWI